MLKNVYCSFILEVQQSNSKSHNDNSQNAPITKEKDIEPM